MGVGLCVSLVFRWRIYSQCKWIPADFMEPDDPLNSMHPISSAALLVCARCDQSS